MVSVQPEEEETKKELNDSGLGHDESMSAKKQVPMEVENAVHLLDLSDDVLLYILKLCTPRDLKALGYTCSRLGSLVLDRTLWERVDARSQPVGVRRMRWLLNHAITSSTRELLLTGYSKLSEGCYGNMNIRFKDVESGRSCSPPDCSNFRGNNFGGLARHPEQIRTPEELERRGLLRGGPVVQIYETMPSGEGPCLPSMQLRMERLANQLGESMPTNSFCPGPQYTLTRPILAAVKSQCTNLTSLGLDYCNLNCMTISVHDFPRTLKKLSLRGTRCYNQVMDKTFLFKIQDNLKELEELDVSECDWVEPSSLLPLSKLPVLHRLYMRNCIKMSECVAYSSLATRYGFNALQVIDLRESPVGDSEVSSFGWVASLEELYVSPALEKNDSLGHGHYIGDPLPVHCELEPWEEQEPEYYTGKFGKTKDSTKDEDMEEPAEDKNLLYMKRKRVFCACSSMNGIYASLDNAAPPRSNEETNKNRAGEPKRARQRGNRDEAGPSKSLQSINEEPEIMEQEDAQQKGDNDGAGPSAEPPAKQQDPKDGKADKTPNGSDSEGADDGSGRPKKSPRVRVSFQFVDPIVIPQNSDDDEALHSEYSSSTNEDDEEKSGKSSDDYESQSLESIPHQEVERHYEENESLDDRSDDDGGLSTFRICLRVNRDNVKRRRSRKNRDKRRVKSPRKQNEENDGANPVEIPLCLDDNPKDLKLKRTCQDSGDDGSDNSNRLHCQAEDQDGVKKKRARQNNVENGAGSSMSQPIVNENGDSVKKKEALQKGADDGTCALGSSLCLEDLDGVQDEDIVQKLADAGTSTLPITLCQREVEDKCKKKNVRQNEPSDVAGPSGSPFNEEGKRDATKKKNVDDDEAGPSVNPLIGGDPDRTPPAADRCERFCARAPKVAKLVCFRQNRDPLLMGGPFGDDDDDIQELRSRAPLHQRLFVNVRRQLHVMYRLSMPVYAIGDPSDAVGEGPIRRLDVTAEPYAPNRFNPAMLVSDTAVHRFGRADSDTVNYINIGPNGVQREVSRGRPDRSNLRVLSVTGFTNITNRSLVHLATAAPRLRLIDFSDTRVTARGVETFKLIRPDCEVIFNTSDKRKEN